MAEAAPAEVPAEQPPAGQQARQTLARVESVAGLVPVTLAHEGSIDENSGTQRMPAQLCEGGFQVGQPSGSSRQAQPTRQAAAAPAAQQLPVKVSVYPRLAPGDRNGAPLPASAAVLHGSTQQAHFSVDSTCMAIEIAGNDLMAADMQLYGGAADQLQQLPEQ